MARLSQLPGTPAMPAPKPSSCSASGRWPPQAQGLARWGLKKFSVRDGAPELAILGLFSRVGIKHSPLADLLIEDGLDGTRDRRVLVQR